MNWQVACQKSKYQKAIRTDKRGNRVLRWVDGSAELEVRVGAGGIIWREAVAREIEGYDDWEPY